MTDASPSGLASTTPAPTPLDSASAPDPDFGARQPAYPTQSPGSAPGPVVSQERANSESGLGASLVPTALSTEEGATSGLAGKVKELVDDASALAGRIGEMARRAAVGVDEVIESAANVVERVGELGGVAAVLADRMQEFAGEVVGSVADAVAGAVSRLFDGAPARSPPAPADFPLVPPAAPAPAVPTPAGGSSSGVSGSGNDHDLPLHELAVLDVDEIALMQGGKLILISGSFLRPTSIFLPTVERPG